MELSALLQAAIANIHGQITEAAEINPEETEDRSLPADPSVRNFSYALVDDQLYYRENSRMHHIKRLKDLNSDNVFDVLMMQKRRKSLALCPKCYEAVHSLKL